MVFSILLLFLAYLPLWSHRALALAAAATTTKTEIAKSVRLDHRIFDSSQWWIFVGKASITFQTEFVFPLPFNSSERTFSFFAILITRLTSCLKNRKTFQWSFSFVLRAFFCHLSRLKGSCMLRVTVPQPDMSATAEFYIVSGQAATLLGRKTSEILAILKVGVDVMNCSYELQTLIMPSL